MNPEGLYFVENTIDDGYVDNLSKVLSRINRVYNQYSSDEKTKSWYAIIPTIGEALYSAYGAISSSYNISTNFGEQLDVIGRVIGVDRSVAGSIQLTVFECGDDSVECGNDFAQLSAKSVSDDSNLEDQYYQTLLKAKVAKNTSYATIDSIILATQIILGSDQEVRLRDSEDMTFTIEVYDPITDITRNLLTKNIIPTPQGVRLRGFLDGAGIVETGDSSLECGNESAECIGLIEVN